MDLITVVFKKELNLLKIQANSISLYFSADTINNIYVIVNDDDNLVDLIDTAWWSQHQHKVKIIPRSHWGYREITNGWESQQMLKLLAAADANSAWSMVLDAKTWFIQSVNTNHLFQEGRCCTKFAQVAPVFTSSQQFVEQYFSVSMPLVISSGVPFIFHTHTVKQLINSVDNFIEFFQTNVRYPNLVTEFHLYSAYVLKIYGNYKTLYNKTHYYDCLNLADYEASTFEYFYKSLNNPRLLTASIHRRTYSLLNQEQKARWVDFLQSRSINIFIENLGEI